MSEFEKLMTKIHESAIEAGELKDKVRKVSAMSVIANNMHPKQYNSFLKQYKLDKLKPAVVSLYNKLSDDISVIDIDPVKQTIKVEMVDGKKIKKQLVDINKFIVANTSVRRGTWEYSLMTSFLTQSNFYEIYQTLKAITSEYNY